MIIKIHTDDMPLKPGDHIVIQRRSEKGDECEELFRWTYPDLGFGKQVTCQLIEIKGREED